MLLYWLPPINTIILSIARLRFYSEYVLLGIAILRVVIASVVLLGPVILNEVDMLSVVKETAVILIVMAPSQTSSNSQFFATIIQF